MLVDLDRLIDNIADRVVEKLHEENIEPTLDTYLSLDSLAERMDLSKTTVRKVVSQMEKEGYKGVFHNGSAIRVSFEKFVAFRGEKRKCS